MHARICNTTRSKARNSMVDTNSKTTTYLAETYSHYNDYNNYNHNYSILVVPEYH